MPLLESLEQYDEEVEGRRGRISSSGLVRKLASAG